jgi:hypothetical protein
MRVLILIISDNHLEIYKYNKEVWRSYMNKKYNISSYFVEFNNEDKYKYPYIDNDTIYIKGEDSFENIIKKTLDSMDYFMNSNIHYDFIVRTNLSCVWDFDRLNVYLESLPSENIYSGTTGPFYNKQNYNFWFFFVGGMGIIMSNDICNLLLKNRHITESFKDMDDTDIGFTMNTLHIPLLFIKYFEVNSITDFDEKKGIINDRKSVFYRTKSIDNERIGESIYMRKIADIIYAYDFIS